MGCKDILGKTKKLVRAIFILGSFPNTTDDMQKHEFSTVSKNDLVIMGVERKLLIMNQDVLEHRLKNSSIPVDQIKLLCAQIKRIYRFVSTRVSVHHWHPLCSLFLLAKPSLNTALE
jgi:hypothetical protein